MRIAPSVPRLLGLLALVPVAGFQAQTPAARTDVPVRRVMLFSSGVGYFEHAGSVRGNGTTELQFKTGQINDILKSLVLQDLDGGKVATITYPSQDPLAKTLRSFQVDITGNPGMADLLNQLRGARVSVQAQGEKLSGTILGVEHRNRPSATGEASEVATLNLLAGAMIRSIDLPSVSLLTLDDPQLQDELAKALQALSQARDQDKKPITINFAGNGDRRVRVGYVVETPIWKTSYRLLLGEKSSAIQGWAIVENQTESDWNDVALSLVSGRPISFAMDLYQPLYLQRPTVVPEFFAGLRPQVYQDGVSAMAERRTSAASPPPPATMGSGSGTGSGVGSAGGRGGFNGSLQTMPQNFTSSVQSAATAAQMGALFEYSIGNVTLARQKSAMLPIVTDSIRAERVSIYNAAVLPRNPLNGVRVTNITGKHLLQGPVTVLDDGAYGGDAQIDNLPPGQQRLLSYGIDLDLQVDNTKNSQTTTVVTGKVVRGVLSLDDRFVASTEYQAENKGTRDRQLVIEHPIRQGWKLAEPLKAVEATATHYRFQVAAAAGKVTVFPVREELVRSQQIAILPADLTTLTGYSRNGEIPVAVRDAIAKAIQLKQAVAATEREISGQTDQINAISGEQERIRENMKTVAANSAYSQRLLAKLNEQETRIEKIQGARDALMVKRDSQQKALEEYLANLTVG